jgi:beta-galactosidase
VFWSQIYNDWEEIELPNLTSSEPNPSHMLDYYRFASDSFVNYQQLQLSILRSQVSDKHFIVTNFMSQFTDLDYYDLAEYADFVTMSSYPTGHGESASRLYMPHDVQPSLAYDVGDPYLTSFGHSLMRGFKPGIPFWVMEQQCGSVNWSSFNIGIRPGTVRLWTWHALASGAESTVYFRWRAGLYAQEQLHSGLLNHDASLAAGYTDVEGMQTERPLMEEISSESSDVQIALLLDYDSVWALQLQPHRKGFDYNRHLFMYYRAIQRLGLQADIVSPEADLSHYKIVIAPSAYVASEKYAQALFNFANAGGTVLLGVRSGFKDTFNQVNDQTLPGNFRSLAGINVNAWHALPPHVGYDLSSSIPDFGGPAVVWAESLSPMTSSNENIKNDPQILAKYTSGPFVEQAALTQNTLGDGQVLYLGFYPGDNQALALLSYLADQSGVSRFADFPDGVIGFRRGKFVILLNFTEESRSATVHGQSVLVASRDIHVVKYPG